MTDQQKQAVKVELKALLDQLTSGAASDAAIEPELAELEQGAAKLEGELASAQDDIDGTAEAAGKMLDALVAEEEAEA